MKYFMSTLGAGLGLLAFVLAITAGTELVNNFLYTMGYI